MAAHESSIYLKFASLQMAAESTELTRYISGAIDFKTSLTLGNNRSSKFTNSLADDFVAGLGSRRPQSTALGRASAAPFFKARRSDPSAGNRCRANSSSPFAPPSSSTTPRATTKRPTRWSLVPFGWAFGQIADMKEWFDELNVDPGKLQGKNFSVTGYSLGGHLATAFNLLMYEAGQADRIFETYTFNGAGVGEIKNGASLTQAINAFRTGQNSGNTDLFTDSLVRALYASVRSSLSNPAPTQAEIDGAMAQVITAQTTARALPNSQTKILRLAQIDTLLLATKRVRSVFDEAERVKNGIDSGDANSAQAKGVAQSVIAAVKLDYQLGILRAKEMTQAYKSGPVDSFGAAYAADRAPLQLFGLSPIQDIYAAPPPSASSQFATSLRSPASRLDRRSAAESRHKHDHDCAAASRHDAWFRRAQAAARRVRQQRLWRHSQLGASR